MAQGYQFYKDRADEAAADADGAELENVRERYLEAEKTWRGLAEQARMVEIERAKAREVRRQRDEADEAERVEEAERAEEESGSSSGD
ncbi:hypothetical protein [Aurantiacibacter hainanensis]|uniref:hypothetical protein n=1 Tax=Aurantiacibacter hainanensis TaxID=3076114 RepID=UPI0030C67E05